MAKGTSGRPTREASILAAYKLLSEDSSFLLNIYRCHHILVVRGQRPVLAATESPYHRKVLRAHQFCRRLKLSYYQWEVSSVCYMLQVPLIVPVCFLGLPHAEQPEPECCMLFTAQHRQCNARDTHANGMQDCIPSLSNLLSSTDCAVVGEAFGQSDCAGSDSPICIWSFQSDCQNSDHPQQLHGIATSTQPSLS